MTRTEIFIPLGETISLPAPVEVEMVGSDGSVWGVASQAQGEMFLTGTSFRTFVVTA